MNSNFIVGEDGIQTGIISMSCPNNAGFSNDVQGVTGQTKSANIEEWPLNVYETTPVLGVKLLYQKYSKTGLSWYFCRVSLPESKTIKSENNKLWGLLKQVKQYKYYKSKLLKYELTSCVDNGYIHFEQFRSGNIHFHMILAIPHHIHVYNLKVEMSELFEIRSKKEMKNFFHQLPIHTDDDFDKVISYLTDKNLKKYESIDQNIYKPIRINRKPIVVDLDGLNKTEDASVEQKRECDTHINIL